MLVYRIVKGAARATDLSGYGAYAYGGRWNSPGVFALYTSESRSLAMLETLVHLDESEFPDDLYMLRIAVPDDAGLLYTFPDIDLPPDWRTPENLALKQAGDRLLKQARFLGFRARSAVMPEEYNVILNPAYPEYAQLVKIEQADVLHIDKRLFKSYLRPALPTPVHFFPSPANAQPLFSIVKRKEAGL